VQAPSAAGSPIPNTTQAISANESGPGATSNTASLTVTPAPLAPTLSKVFGAAGMTVAQSTSLTFNVANPNASTDLVNIAVADILPSGLIVASPNGLTGTCVSTDGAAVTANPGSGAVSLLSLNLTANTSCSFAVNVTAVSQGTQVNVTGNITGTFDTGGGNFATLTGLSATATLNVAGGPIMAIGMTSSGTFSRGQNGATYTIVVGNTGVAPTIGTVTVTDTLPSPPNTLTPTALSGTGWTCTLGTLTCTRSDSLATNTSYPPITLAVNVPVTISANTNLTNSATVSGGGDPNSHTVSNSNQVGTGSPIQVALAVGSITVNVGGTGTVPMTVTASPGEGMITFACSGLPFGASCSFNPSSTNQQTTSVTMSVTTSPGTGSVVPFGPGRMPPSLYAVVLPLLGLIGLWGTAALGRGRKPARLRLAFALTGLALFLALMGCGGSMTTPPTPKGTFQVSVTATSTTTGDSGSAVVSVTVPQ
jgi:uncharacterized repeat protein (TIGR01451 family)